MSWNHGSGESALFFSQFGVILYKAKNIYGRWPTCGPAGTAMKYLNQGGWKGDNFLSWFDWMFIPSLKPILSTGPVVLFVDGHHSHISVDLIMKAREMGIATYFMSSSTYHSHAPTTRCLSIWTTENGILREQRIESPAAEITKEHYPSKCY